EFFLAGASAVQIGTYSFVDPSISISIVEGIENYLMSKGFSDIKDIVGYINK
ncbi:MAG TPA: dihydroorotate dehydrogenase, partial [Bacteroidetes bacterium]|nr:dihydroorotate dehydrogenase [Bacteroidota bacterium]